MGYFDEFYSEAEYEPSAIDEIVAEAKAKIEEIVKDSSGRSIKDIMAENKLLKSVVEEINKEKRNYASLKYELQNEHNNRIAKLEIEFYNSKLSEIFQKCNPVAVGYTLNGRYIPKTKCSHCNDDRKIVAVDTTGVEHIVNCSCSKAVFVWSVLEAAMTSISFWKRGGYSNNIDPSVYYYMENESTDSLKIHYTNIAKDVFDPANPGSTYHILYTNKEAAQQHCDLLNDQAGITAEILASIPDIERMFKKKSKL